MSHKHGLSIVLLLFVVAVAGCVGQLPSIPGFGTDVITPSRTLTSGPATNIILIDKLISSPETTAYPEQTINIFMTAASHETDARRTTPVNIQLFDAFIFKDASGQQTCNALPGGCKPVGELCTMEQSCIFSAFDTKQLQWTLRAPTRAEIANIATQGTLSYRLLYTYNSSTNFDVLVVTENEILRLQQEGQTLSLPLQESRSGGPIALEFSQPVQFALPGGTVFTTVKVLNAGSGSLLNSTIAAGALTVEIPAALVGYGEVKPPEEYFNPCLPQLDKLICTNKKPIQLIKKESIPLLFEIRNVVPDLAVPHRTFTLSATVSYTYEIRSSLTLTIQPLAV